MVKVGDAEGARGVEDDPEVLSLTATNDNDTHKNQQKCWTYG